MVASRDPATASGGPVASGSNPEDGSAAQDSISDKAELEAIWRSGRTAAELGVDLARIRFWQLGVVVRSAVARLLLRLFFAAVVAAAAVTAAAWTTFQLLHGLSALVGGGLPGLALAVAGLLIVGFATALAARVVGARARRAHWREQLNKTKGGPSADRPRSLEQAALSDIERRTREELRQTGARFTQHGSRLLRAHPIATVGVSAITGFTASRVLLATPRRWRRGVVSAIRLAQTSAIAFGTDALMQALRGKSPPESNDRAD